MEAFGSPSISRAPMGGVRAFRIPKTSVCGWQVQRILGVIGYFVAIIGTAAVSVASAKSRIAYCFSG